MAALVKRERNGDSGNDGQWSAIEELKTIDGDYCDGCYGWRGVKRVAVFREKAERTRRACVEAKDHGRAGRRSNTLVTQRERMCGNRLGYVWPAVFR
jgi:hypothetical protein